MNSELLPKICTKNSYHKEFCDLVEADGVIYGVLVSVFQSVINYSKYFMIKSSFYPFNMEHKYP